MAQALVSVAAIGKDEGSADEDISSAGEATRMSQRKRSAIPTRHWAEHSLFVRKRAKGSWGPCHFDDDGAQRVPKRLRLKQLLAWAVVVQPLRNALRSKKQLLAGAVVAACVMMMFITISAGD